MQLVNYPNTLQAAPVNTHSLKRWIPAAILVAAVSAVSFLGTTDKPSDDINWLSRLANTGDVGAELQVGLAYRDGRFGLTPDAAKGFTWIKRAAEAGNAYAEDTLASMYATGTGTEKDLHLAKQWWNKAMHDGDNAARLHLSETMIREGDVQQAERILR